jgi:agmatinase
MSSPSLPGGGLEGPGGFLGLEEAETPYEDARFVVLPVPYEGTVSFQGGTARGPGAILDASREVELWDEELDLEPWRAGLHTLSPLEATADGPTGMASRIREVASTIVADGKTILALGGEHSITPPLAEAARERHGTFSTLLVDAHADLRQSWGGTPLSHACTAHRLRGGGPVVVVGARAFCREERDLAERDGVLLVRARDIAGSSPEAWIPRALEPLGEKIYLSFDVDGLDPSIMPATGTPVPGGLGWWEALALLREACRGRTVVGMDLVELAPIPGLVAPDFLVAQLAHKMIGYTLVGNPEGSRASKGP